MSGESDQPGYMTRRTALKSIAGSTMLGLAGCSGLGSSETSDLTIGLSIPLSGAFSGKGSQYQAGFKTWESKIQEQDGIDDNSVEVIYEDNESSEDTAARIANQFVEDGVDFAVSAYASSLARATAPPLSQENIPLVATGSNNHEIYSNYENMFMYEPPLARKGEGSILSEQGIDKVASIVVDFGWARMVQDRFLESVAPDNGLDVVYSDVHPPDADDLSSFVLKAKQSGADAVITTNYPSDVVNVVRSMISNDYQPKFLSSHTANIPSVGDQLGSSVEGMIVPTTYSENMDTYENDEFPSRFSEVKESEEVQLGVDAAHAYSALQVFENAITETSGEDSLINTLNDGEFKTVTGDAQFDSNGVQKGFTWRLTQWRDDSSHQIVWPEDRAEADLIHPKPWN